jgi:hypothetical protein
MNEWGEYLILLKFTPFDTLVAGQLLSRVAWLSGRSSSTSSACLLILASSLARWLSDPPWPVRIDKSDEDGTFLAYHRSLVSPVKIYAVEETVAV